MSDVAGWINQIIHDNPSLPFSRAQIEQSSARSLKRRDLSLFDRNGKLVLNGEAKLPFARDGASPFNQTVIEDARAKAKRAGSPFFFTWNVNDFLLWKTGEQFTDLHHREYKRYEVTHITRPEELASSSTEFAIKKWLETFLAEFADICQGQAQIGVKPPDQLFVESMESHLDQPIAKNFEKLQGLYSGLGFKNKFDQWMTAQLGWVISDDPEDIRHRLEDATRLSCYTLINNLVFYEALLKNYRTRLKKIPAPKSLTDGEALRVHLNRFFGEAEKITGDYETVFGEDPYSFIKKIPFYSDDAVRFWLEIIDQIHLFDFSKLDYEVIGGIFERLISPDERKKFGMFYTRVEVVDLINSFCIQHGDEKVMDPACGGGTFLVRAYARKRELAPARGHSQLLTDLYGVDIASNAAHLTIINLATRDLISDENYPQVAVKDFFDVNDRDPLLFLPRHLETKGLGKIQRREVKIEPLDAVVGNPPYIRQERIDKKKKAQYLELVAREAPGLKLAGRSDIHLYFWPHAASFLKDDGWLCFLTSSQWLDVEYGFKLQKWILENFEVVAVIESQDEPWFVGARVATAVTILKKQPDEQKRMANRVRFIQTRKPLSEIMAHGSAMIDAVEAANNFRDEILALEKNESNSRFRARLVPQADLWAEGVKLGKVLGQDGTDYYGGKWGIHLRAPDLWFKLLRDYGDKMVPLGEIADIKFGVKSGNDSFFFPIDFSQEALEKFPDPAEFRESYGVPRRDVENGRVKLVKCGEGHGEVRPIEAKYLEPEAHSLMEVDGYSISPDNCKRMILQVNKPKEKLTGPCLINYLLWGESIGVHKQPTCEARVGENDYWYDLTKHERASVLWPKEYQYKFIAPLNEKKVIANCRFYEVINDLEPSLLAGILNSTITLLSSFQYGRPMGVEGNWSTMVSDVTMLMIPKPDETKSFRIKSAFSEMMKRSTLQLLSEKRLRAMAYTAKDKLDELSKLSDRSELDMPDRRELDDAVLEMMGVKSAKRRAEMIDELYAYLREFFELTRRKEEKAIVNKNQYKRKGPAKPRDLARQILEELKRDRPELLNPYSDFIAADLAVDEYNLPADGAAARHEDLFKSGVIFGKGKKAEVVEVKVPEQVPLLILLAANGVRGNVIVPRGPEECGRAQAELEKFFAERDQAVASFVAERTADEELQDKIRLELTRML